ncbi:hypothetical protein QYM36_005837 [Artemia franciscana]|uniref:Reverse transcriptase domain-containing protein n=1 Tax=Artemia franciscana TaxID=6661 RepID=A0AA88I0D4_ARTSF|nr:hypothetical protein QYM36_005837 [Artemia franciscana]
MVMIEKMKGTVRLCIDPVDLNKCIKHPYYPIPIVEDVTARPYGVKVFSKMDARSKYWLLVLSARASEMTTFSTIFGRHRFLRIPFGLLSAQDEFHCCIEEAFEGLEGLAIIIDDILTYGVNQEDHDERLRAVMERALEKGVKINKDKSSFNASSICYFWHVVGADGMKLDPEKL